MKTLATLISALALGTAACSGSAPAAGYMRTNGIYECTRSGEKDAVFRFDSGDAHTRLKWSGAIFRDNFRVSFYDLLAKEFAELPVNGDGEILYFDCKCVEDCLPR